MIAIVKLSILFSNVVSYGSVLGKNVIFEFDHVVCYGLIILN
jgi:hypothetical protein